MTPTIIGTGTAVPPHTYTQEQIYRLFEKLFGQNPLAGKIFLHSPIRSRHFIIAPSEIASYRDGQWTTAERNGRYASDAAALAREAIDRCLVRLDLPPSCIDHFIVTTCTGCITPGLDIRLAAACGMRSDIRRTHIGGMGCYAAFPALQAAVNSLEAENATTVLILCAELCSLHLQPTSNDDDIVSASLFSDGAAACVVRATEKKGFPKIIRSATLTDYQTADQMTWDLGDHGFRMRLSSYVPHSIGSRIREFVENLINPLHLQLSDIRHWIVHPGGPRILDRVQESLGLSEKNMTFSWETLRSFGNMSSPTVFFTLDQIMEKGDPRPGDFGVMLGFGPGLTLESCLLRW